MPVNFGFAFDNPLFSDRILQFDIVSVPNSTENQVSSASNADNEENKMQAKKLHVSSVILAAHSDYFMRLFSNGMSESKSGIAVVKVTETEMQGMHDLIEYMYTGQLRESSDAEAAIILLCLADRFAISSCMEPLADVLKMYPGTINDCLLVLGLPESLKSNKAVQPVVEQCRNYLAQQFPDIAGKKSEFLSLSIEGVKVVLDSDTIHVQYEEEVFQYFLDWLEANCEDLKSKMQAADEIAKVIRFPWMTGDFLVDVVANSPPMLSNTCQALVMEAVTFKSFPHSRQQLMIWKKTEHNRYKPRNNLILENFWGNSKTHVVKHSNMSCQVYFEFPLELVICTGQTFQSRSFSLGPNKYTFYLEARHGPVKTSYNQQLTCCISLVLPPNPQWKASEVNLEYTLLEYTVAMKRDCSQNYDTKATGWYDLHSAEVAGTCIQFNDFFSGWFIERGFSFPRWNLTINGPVFFRFDFNLKESPSSKNQFIED